ncbi:hypothetical protein X742_01500 [Mesorhizobium sp. LNHC232B00]|nr:hypothetical protein X742_01500 [Mesorhizobium sp. LNHC232B00]
MFRPTHALSPYKAKTVVERKHLPQAYAELLPYRGLRVYMHEASNGRPPDAFSIQQETLSAKREALACPMSISTALS